MIGRILAIDYGRRRIGLSISDPLGISAQKLPTLDRETHKDYIQELINLIKEKRVIKIILGYPLNADGTESEISIEVKGFRDILREKTGLEVILWDERDTSKEAKKLLHQMGIKGRKRENIDQLAAIILLQSYLETQA